MSFQNQERRSKVESIDEFFVDVRSHRPKRAKIIASIISQARERAEKEAMNQRSLEIYDDEIETADPLIGRKVSREYINPVRDAITGFKWTHQMTIRLLDLIKDNFRQLEFGIKKNTYNEIAHELNSVYNCNLTHEQIDSKWKGLKKQYKKIKEDIYRKGRIRTAWPYYEIVDEILSSCPEGPAVLSSEDQDTTSTSLYQNEVHHKSSQLKRKLNDDCNDPLERRHREKMEVANRFLDLFEQLVNKMS